MTGPASWNLKLDRAEEHLSELSDLIKSYTSGHPYHVARTGQGWELVIEPPPDRLAVVLGDLVHNVRSALDHLMAALVPRSRARDVYFPILFVGVWDDAGADGKRWRRYTKGAPEPAVELLKTVQPPPEPDPLHRHPLEALRALSNADKHYQLIGVRSRLLAAVLLTRDDRGSVAPCTSDAGARDALAAGTPINPPAGVAEILSIEGNLVVAVEIGDNPGPHSYMLPGPFADTIRSTRILEEQLRPHLRASGSS